MFRVREGRYMREDCIALRSEKQEGSPLLKNVMIQGERQEPETLSDLRKRCEDEIRSLDAEYMEIGKTKPFPVKLSKGIQDVQRAAVTRIREETL